MTAFPLDNPSRDLGKTTSDSSSELFQGKKIGNYELLSRLGRGAMGEIWKAYGKGKVVALKIPRRPEFLRHLQREVALLESVHHPKVAKIFEADLKAETPYLAMEFIEGKPLRSICTGMITSSQVTILCDQILEGLSAIHSAGFLHLDLKPENILLDEKGNIKIVDFGLGKAVSTWMAEVYLSASLVSREIPMAGTLAYMAPEQRKGKEVDERTDLYAFGVLLHEVLSGKLPDPTLRLSQMRDDLPPRWDVVVAKLTHPDPLKRPSSAKEARQLTSFTFAEKEIKPVEEGGIPPRDLSMADQQAFQLASPYSPGMKIRNYILKDLLGRGGYGEVWRAEKEMGKDVFGVEREGETVALKILLKRESFSAFAKEAEIVKRLSHPAIPKLLEDASSEDPPFLVFELIEGKSLRYLLHEKEKFSLSEAIPLFFFMVEALQACHNGKVIHRDLKPEHFVVDLRPKASYPIHLIDFGLAGVLEKRRHLDHTLGTQDEVGGTFDYMAPEQKEGDSGAPADVYSLGICFFEMLTGSLPKGPQRLRMLCREAPEELDQMVLQMLNRNPALRLSLKKVEKSLESIFHIKKEGHEIGYKIKIPAWKKFWKDVKDWWEDFKEKSYNSYYMTIEFFQNYGLVLVVIAVLSIILIYFWYLMRLSNHHPLPL